MRRRAVLAAVVILAGLAVAVVRACETTGLPTWAGGLIFACYVLLIGGLALTYE